MMTFFPAHVRRPLPLVFLAVCCAAFACYVFGPNLRAQWWIIDDHEIMWVIGEGERLSIDQFVPRLLGSEVGQFGEYQRFRPVYYSLRLGESALWGKQAVVWYGFRILIYVLFAFVLSIELARGVGAVSAGLLTFFTITFDFWSDVFSRLGPSEAYATLGLAWFVIGFRLVYSDAESKTGWLLLLMGTIVATGSKESFLVLILPVAYLAINAIAKRKARLLSGLFGGLSVVWCAWIAAAIILAGRRTGADIYGNSLGMWERLHSVWLGAAQPFPISVFSLGGLLLLVGIGYRKAIPAVTRLSAVAFLGLSFCILLYLSQTFFYGGTWPTGSRYDLPGMLAVPLTLFVMLWYLRRLSRITPFLARLRAIAPTSMMIVAVAAAGSHLTNTSELRQYSLSNVRRTKRFTSLVAMLSELGKQHPNYPFVYQSDDPWDYEPFFSYPRFLMAEGVKNDAYLIWLSPDDRALNSFESSLSGRISQISQFGLQPYYSPVDRLGRVGQDCILVVISDQQPGWPCIMQVDGDWRKY